MTPRDLVEFPGQVNEHWVLERDVLNRFARHAQTGAPMPQALVEKIETSETFNQGFATVGCRSSITFSRAIPIPPAITVTCGPR